MFDIGGPEFVFLLLLALIVFGPKRLPELARQFGSQTAKFRESWLEFRRTLEREAALGELKKAGREVRRVADEARSAAGSLALGELPPADDEAAASPAPSSDAGSGAPESGSGGEPAGERP